MAAADGGVLFLDEVAEIPVSTQVKLLRVLERSEWTPVGADTVRRGDFRLICATHRDLPAMVRAGEFRHDLYFRIAGFTVRIPPLRERPDDIETLVRHFLELSIQESDGRTPLVTDEAMRQLRSRAWPGNVRELRNAMERAVIVARGGPIHPEHLPESVLESDASEDSDHRSEPDADPLKHAVTAWTQRSLVAQPEAQNLYDQLMEAVEPALLATLLQRHHGRIAAVARSLGIHRTTVPEESRPLRAGCILRLIIRTRITGIPRKRHDAALPSETRSPRWFGDLAVARLRGWGPSRNGPPQHSILHCG